MRKLKCCIGNYSAFTLAEVLITLVVIGVIAALTVPALITNMQEAQYKVAWRKTFSDITQATRKIANDNAGSLVGVFSNNNDVRDKLSTHLSYIKKCDGGIELGVNGCWHSQFYYLGGDDFAWWDLTGWSRMVLNNGSLVAFAGNPDCNINRPARQNGCSYVAVDVNGFKGPNTVGKDVFWGFITEDGSFEPFGKQGDFWSNDAQYGCNLNADPNADGFTCSTQYLRQ